MKCKDYHRAAAAWQMRDQRHMFQYENEQTSDEDDDQAGQCCGRVYNNLEERVRVWWTDDLRTNGGKLLRNFTKTFTTLSSCLRCETSSYYLILKPLSHLRTDAADRSEWSTDEISRKLKSTETVRNFVYISRNWRRQYGESTEPVYGCCSGWTNWPKFPADSSG